MAVLEQMVEGLALWDADALRALVALAAAAVWPLAALLCFGLALLKALWRRAAGKASSAAPPAQPAGRLYPWRVFCFGGLGWALFIIGAAVAQHVDAPLLPLVGTCFLLRPAPRGARWLGVWPSRDTATAAAGLHVETRL